MADDVSGQGRGPLAGAEVRQRSSGGAEVGLQAADRDAFRESAERDALRDVGRLRALRRVCLDAAPDPAFDRFAGLVKRLLKVPVALVSLVDDERQFFPGMVGLTEPWRSKRETPMSHSFCRRVVIEGRSKVYPDALADPEVRDNPAIRDMGVRAYAGMPLTDADGRTLGSLCAIDTAPRDWTVHELDVLRDLAEACSSELRLRIARDVADEARRHAERAHDQLAMLAELTESLAATLDTDDSLQRVAQAVVPRLADWCFVSLVGENGTTSAAGGETTGLGRGWPAGSAGAAQDGGRGGTRQVAAVHRDPVRAAAVTRVAELLAGDFDSNSVLRGVLRTGRSYLEPAATLADLRTRTSNEELIGLAQRLGYGAHLTVAITAPVTQRVLGTITLVNGEGRAPFTPADRRTAVDIGRRAGLALDNQRLYREQRHVAEVLQHSLLTDLPEIPGLDLHARYLPAQHGAAVGGDWYDAFVQPDGAVMLAVGDVTGHDIEAAATMGQLRNLVRGDAYGREDEAGPLLAQLDRAVRGLRMPANATVVLARLRGRTVTYANAGHPPPLLLRPDGTVEVWWTTPEPLLGLASAHPRTTHSRQVPAGSTLVLYTDGLVEEPGQLIDSGIDRVARVLSESAGVPAEELCARLVESAGRRADDIAVLLVRVD